MKYDRFNLEEEIQNIWQTKDDLDAIAERHYDDPEGPMTEDEISNVLIGLSELHETSRDLQTISIDVDGKWEEVKPEVYEYYGEAEDKAMSG